MNVEIRILCNGIISNNTNATTLKTRILQIDNILAINVNENAFVF